MKIEKCPFCGGEQAIIARYIGYGSLGLGGHDEYRVVCKECRASSDEYKSEAKAIAAWNRRAEPDHIGEANGMVQPENERLTMNELISMNGLPVWCVDGEGHGCYCLVNTDNEDCIDSESGAWCFEFYNMVGNGKHGLHNMGWLAYRHKKEEV